MNNQEFITNISMCLIFVVVVGGIGSLVVVGLWQDIKTIEANVTDIEKIDDYKYLITFDNGENIKCYINSGTSDFTVHSKLIVTFTKQHLFGDWRIYNIVKVPS